MRKCFEFILTYNILLVEFVGNRKNIDIIKIIKAFNFTTKYLTIFVLIKIV